MATEYKKAYYERIGTLTLDDVFPHIAKHIDDYKKKRVQINEFSVNVQSLRLKTFYHTGLNCPCCENKGSFFAVERNTKSGGYHLNLYGIDDNNQEILFTHDHKLARGLGGEDLLSNTQTMCGPCNWSKGHLENKMCQALIQNDIEMINSITQELKKYEITKMKVKI